MERPEGRPLSEPVPPGFEGLPPGRPEPGASPWRRALGLVLPLLGLALFITVLLKIPFADRVHLADGRVLTGRLLASSDDGVRFEPEGAAPLTVPAADLAVRKGGLPAVEEGLRTLAGRMRPLPMGGAFLLVLGMIALALLRWRMLLRAQGVEITVGRSAALTFLGNFFNQVVPGGIVGGDVLKAVYIARGREKRAGAVVSVFVDRILGLTGTVLLASVALVPLLDDPAFARAAILSYAVLVGGIGGAVLVFSRRLRRLLRADAWLARIPLIGGMVVEADRAVQLYRDHRGRILLGLGMSLGVHSLWCVANWVIAGMLGLDLPLIAFFAVIPAVLVISAIPLAPGAWGVGEAAFVFFFGGLGVAPAQAVALSVIGRSVQLVLALPGGIVFASRRA